MLNNVQQNNTLLNNMGLQQKLEDRRVFDQFMNKPTHVTRDAAKGRLVKENPIQQFGSMFVDTADDIKNLGTAIVTGKSNDHALGRMNDVGMKIGGGLIAAALMGARSTTNKKLMEVVGFTTFFSAMSLWPKIAVDIPTKLRYGFNPHQKYIDSQGRKKQFFLDNQYLPWDVWSKEDINKIADKMNVPKDLTDREEYTKEKMRTIALQDNTLWMLTAGFASPLLTSLCCNRVEEMMKNSVSKAELKKVIKNIENSDEIVQKIFSNSQELKKQDEAFGAIIKSLKEGTMPDNLEGSLGGIFNISNIMKNDELKNRLNGNQAGTRLYNTLFSSINKDFVFEDSELLKYLTEGETEDKAKEILEKLKAAKAAVIKENGKADLLKIVSKIEETEAKNGGMSLLTGSAEFKENWMTKLSDLSNNNPTKTKQYAQEMTKYDKEALSRAADELEQIYKQTRTSQAQMKFFEDNIQILNNVSGDKYNKVAKSFMKSLGISNKELTVLKRDSEVMGDNFQEFFEKKIQSIAKNEAQYQKTMKTLDKEIDALGQNPSQKGIAGKIGATFDALASKVKGSTAVIKEGVEGNAGNIILEGINDSEIDSIKTDMTSVRSTLLKLKSTLSLEKEIADESIFKKWAAIAQVDESSIDKEALVKQFRRFCWQSSYGDAMNKGYATGNGEFFENLIKTVFSNAPEGSDEAAWKKFVSTLFMGENYVPNPSLSKEGDKIWGSFTQKAWEAFNKYNGEHPDAPIGCFGDLPKETIEAIQKEVAGDKADAIFKPSNIKFANFGESLLSTFKKQVNTMYNDRKWLKVFGGATAALIGFTFISQLFFGKVKDEELYKKKAQNTTDTFESGK